MPEHPTIYNKYNACLDDFGIDQDIEKIFKELCDVRGLNPREIAGEITPSAFNSASKRVLRRAMDMKRKEREKHHA